jgi:ribonucleoside-triphosphate reductase
MMPPEETTDITLFVRTSGEEIARWDRRRIVEALIRETGSEAAVAEEISREVERQIVASGIAVLTTSLIRELVDAKLVERGLEQARRMHARLGFPLYDVEQLILHPNRENANVPHGPEGTNLILAEGIKREYALHHVFSRGVADAHIAGDFHLHGLGAVDRPYSACQTLEYLKTFGLQLPHALNAARPARHPEVLLAHMVRFAAALQGHFAGVIGWLGVNHSFAPYLTGMTDREVEHFAQMLIYEFSQLTSARGGQSIYTDMHLSWETPAFLAGIPAVGPGGEATGETCDAFAPEAQRFARGLMAVFRAGDATGRPFTFPRPVIHLSPRFFATPGHEAFLEMACDVAADKGNPCFVFDRVDTGSAGLPFCPEAAGEPWRVRGAALMNVTLNLPRIAYRAEGDERRLFGLLSELLALAVRAQVEKKAFLKRILGLGARGPLALLAMDRDGAPYLDPDRAGGLIGMVGLNELVQIQTGEQLHASPAARAFGLKVVSRMRDEVAALGQASGIPLALEQTPAETTAHRFARLDLRFHSPASGRIVKGSIARGDVYYTNSTHLYVGAPVTPPERIEMEGRFHPLIPSDAITHIFLGAARPSGAALARLVETAFRQTACAQIAFTPEFTSCAACGRTRRGLFDRCPDCGADAVEGITRITQYVTGISSWNKGKRAELKDRNRHTGFFPDPE